MTQIKCRLIAITENLAKDGGFDELDKQCQKTAQISSKATEKCGPDWLGPVNNKWKSDKVISNRHLYQKIEVLRKTEGDPIFAKTTTKIMLKKIKWERYCMILNVVSLENQTCDSFFVHCQNTFEIMNAFLIFSFHDKNPN